MKKLALTLLFGFWAFSAQAQTFPFGQSTQAPINLSCTTTPTALITGVAGKSINLMKISFTLSATATLTFQDSNGTPVVFSGPFSLGSGGGITWVFDGAPWISTTVAGRSLNVVCSGTTTLAGVMVYQLTP